MHEIADHRRRLGGLVACYLVFMNATRMGLADAAGKLGITLEREGSDNPLRYAAIYPVALVLAVYIGVYLSAVVCDLTAGTGVAYAMANEDMSDVQRWAMLAFGDYGMPILGIPVLRYFAWLISPSRGYSPLVAYAWIFLVRRCAVHLRPYGHGRTGGAVCRAVEPILGSVPARSALGDWTRAHLRLYQPLPGSSDGSYPARYRAAAIVFTFGVMLFTLPAMPMIQPDTHGVWGVAKLRFVAMGTIFCVTLCLALAVQFGLLKPAQTKVTVPAQPDGDIQHAQSVI